MKVRLLLLFFVSLVTFTSCLKENEENIYIYGGLATAHVLDNKTGYFFELDNGKTLYTDTYIKNGLLRDSIRVFVSFYIDNENMSGYDYVGRLQYIDTVLTKKPIIYETAIPDSIGTDELTLNEGYIYQKYLNVSIAVQGAYSTHRIDLVKDGSVSDTDEEYIDVELRHKRLSGDDYSYLGGVLCFDISDLKVKYPGKKGVRVKLKDYNAAGGESVHKFDFWNSASGNNGSNISDASSVSSKSIR